MHDGVDTRSGGEDVAVVVRKRRKGIYILPNLFTLAALFGGFYAIVMAMNGRFENACIGIFCAAVLDSLDGRVARMTNTQSAFGEQMDSLSDMVSFGAAPALIAYEWSLKGLGRWGWIAAFVYCACAALRLARFNVNTAVVDKRYFQGLPSPAAAALVTGFIWIMTEAEVARGSMGWPMFVLALYAGLISGTSMDGVEAVHVHNAHGWERAEIGSRLYELFDIRFRIFKRKFMVKFLNNLLAQVTPFLFYAVGGYLALVMPRMEAPTRLSP